MVERTVYVGTSRQVIVRLATGMPVQVSVANTGGAEEHGQGTPVNVHVPPEALRVLVGEPGGIAPEDGAIVEPATTAASS